MTKMYMGNSVVLCNMNSCGYARYINIHCEKNSQYIYYQYVY